MVSFSPLLIFLESLIQGGELLSAPADPNPTLGSEGDMEVQVGDSEDVSFLAQSTVPDHPQEGC